MNAMSPFAEFKTPYWQVDAIERRFVDGYVKDIETIADKTGQQLLAVLHAPFPYQLEQRAVAMLARPMVRAAIAERVKDLSNLYDLSIPRTLREEAALAYSTMENYVTVDAYGNAEIDLTDLTPEMWKAIKSIEVEDKPRGGRKTKLQLYDKQAALNTVMRYQGLLSDDNLHWRNQEQAAKPNIVSKLPANIDDDAAARLYAREING